MRIVLLVVFALTGCLNSLDPWESNEFRLAERKWNAADIDDYRYEMRTSCFCPPEYHEWAVVEVRNNQVVSAASLDGTPVSGFSLASRKTVDELFDAVRIDNEWVGDVSFDFDRDLGYPLLISIGAKKNVADAGVVYEARNLQRAE
jgi:hypothetical protein